MLRLFALVSALFLAAAAHATTLYVNAPDGGFLNLRSGPSTGYPVQYQMPHGTAVEVLRAPGTWVQIRHESGRTGWASSKYLAPLDALQQQDRPGRAEEALGTLPVFYVDAPGYGGLNLRAGPGTENAVLITMLQGSKVEELGRKGTWRLLRHDSGEVGWAHGDYLSVIKPGQRQQQRQPGGFDAAPEYDDPRDRGRPSARARDDDWDDDREDERDEEWREDREGWEDEHEAEALGRGRGTPDERSLRRYYDGRQGVEALPGLLLRCSGREGNALANCIARGLLEAQP